MPSLIPRPRLHSKSKSASKSTTSSSQAQGVTRTSRAADDVTLPAAPQQTQQLQGGKPAASTNADRGPRYGSGAGVGAGAGGIESNLISTRASPAAGGHENQAVEVNKDSSGLFNRLLQRGKSLKRKPRPSSRGISAATDLDSDQLQLQQASRPPADEGAIAGISLVGQQQQRQLLESFSNSPQNASALQQQDQPRATPIAVDPAPVPETTVPPNSQVTKSLPGPGREDNLETPTMAKPIARKPSLRDRFRLKPAAATQSPEEQRKPPVIYIPKHAAADFSRMAASSRPRASYSFDEDRTLSPRTDELGVDPHALTKELEELQIKPNRHSSTLQPLPEAELEPFAHKAQHQHEPTPKQDHRRGLSRNQSVPSAKPRGQRQRHSQTKTVDVSEPPAAPAPEPRSPAHRHNASTASAPLPAAPRQIASQEPEKQATRQTEQHAGLSDFELFLQRAEQEDRAQRERMLHGIPYRMKTQPPLNPFYTTNFAPVSAPAPALDDIREADHPGPASSPPSDAPLVIRAGLAAGGGSRSSGTRTRRDSSQYGYQLHAGPASGGNPNPNRGSWSASNEAEREKERKASGGVIPEYTLPVDASYVGASSGVQYPAAAREPRGLKRQGSITQRIAEYIKPSRERARYGHPVSPTAVPRQ